MLGSYKAGRPNKLVAKETGRLGSQETGKLTKMGGARASEFFSLHAS